MRRSVLRWFFLISPFFLGVTGRATTRAFFTSQESVEKELVRLIDGSQSTIDMALFRFASQPLARALQRARARGVQVRLVLDGHKEADEGLDHLKTAFVAGEVRRLDGKMGGARGIMHHKFVLFDGRRLVTGSFNWTASAEHVNYENALSIDDASAVAAYRKEFQTLWNRAEELPPSQFQTTASTSQPRRKAKKMSFSSRIKKAPSVIKRKRRTHTKRK